MTDPLRDFEYTPADFNVVRELIRQAAGIRLADSKDSLVYSRLAPRLRSFGFKSVKEYLAFLMENDEETQHFINLLTTNLTSFYREPHHFEILTEFVKSGEKVQRVWCSASSTGEEPYSIAMTLVKAFESFNACKIIASDIDSNVLAKAQKGIYALKQVDVLADKKRFFRKGTGPNIGFAKVIPELKKMIEFKRINLMDERLPINELQDVIFCRNVMIYFDRETQLEILKKLVEKLRPGGLYVAGHSEHFSGMSEYLHPIGKTVYMKK
ncbi:CheR family methyltransferase [Marinomonas spartinae]|uniref:CheR family methyltransferase n=1 Tax=Marinomonas spartinae TaxID=1792290 RepID=UPI0018F18B4A|nr:CheR family methyltransferase [Marinomonas spartinae]MBJ7554399.1 chemotaxis protein CheR [Marinomonas spartinae]